MNIFAQKHVDHYQSDGAKQKPDWYVATFNTLAGIAKAADNGEMKHLANLINAVIDKKDYNSFMNPFDFKEERHQNIPGTIRNYDIIMSNVRKFIGEYTTSYQEFHVISKLPDEDNAMLDAANQLAYRLLSKKALQQVAAMEGAVDPNQKEIDVKGEVEAFKLRWKDERVVNDYDMLEYLRANTEDAYLYAKAYTHWIIYGRYFIERHIENDDVVKTVMEPVTTFPIYNDSDFVEDYDGVYNETIKSISQIKAHYKKYLTREDMAYLEKMEKFVGTTGSNTTEDTQIIYGLYKAIDPEAVDANKGTSFSQNASNVSVGTLYYKGMREVKVLEYKDILGNTFEKMVDNDYELNPLLGDIKLTSEWVPTVYVQYRFGSQYKGVYTKPFEVEVQRQFLNNEAVVKLPVTGKVGIFPLFPNHSIPKLLYPFQVTVNLLYLARERAILTSVGKIGIIPKEMLGSDAIDQEEQMYNMMVLKRLFITTEGIPNINTVIQAIKDINLSDYEHIKMLTELINETTEAAKNTIDMNRQREGNSYASEGKGAAQDAVTRVSMGSAIINITFDLSRSKDYNADIDFTKVAWINGKKGKFVTSDRQQKFFEVNPVTHCETEYGVFVTNSVEYDMQKQAIQDYAFNLGQGGVVEEDVILDIITNKNITKLKEIILTAKDARNKREDDKFQQEQQTRQIEAQQRTQAANDANAFMKQLNDDNNLTKLLIKEVELTIKDLDMQQQDKNNEVLANIQRQKQELQTALNLFKR